MSVNCVIALSVDIFFFVDCQTGRVFSVLFRVSYTKHGQAESTCFLLVSVRVRVPAPQRPGVRVICGPGHRCKSNAKAYIPCTSTVAEGGYRSGLLAGLLCQLRHVGWGRRF